MSTYVKKLLDTQSNKNVMTYTSKEIICSRTSKKMCHSEQKMGNISKQQL